MSAHRHRRVIVIITVLLACGLLLALFLSWATTIRQSGVRAMKQGMLSSIAQAAAIYQRDTGNPPTLDTLLTAKLIDPTIQREFSRATLTPPSPTAPILVQTTPCRAVRKGEPWGGPGETIDHHLPACRFVLLPDWTVTKLDEPDYQRDWAGKLTLTPLK